MFVQLARVIAFVVTIHAVGAVSAATLVATGLDRQEDFTITFDDVNGNRLFDLAEFDTLSGPFVTNFAYDSVIQVPGIAGIAVLAELPGTAFPGQWVFKRTSGPGQGDLFSSTPNFWTYEITGLPAIPLPPSMALVLTALGALGLVRRRARR
jgi:hypothetical protein